MISLRPETIIGIIIASICVGSILFYVVVMVLFKFITRPKHDDLSDDDKVKIIAYSIMHENDD